MVSVRPGPFPALSFEAPMHPTSRLRAGAARRRVAGLCCLPLLALAGCSGGQEDPEPIIRTDAASESPASPSAEPGKQPWQKRTKAGAVAFVRHWVEVFNEAGASGDTRELREISAPGCTSCRQVAEAIDQWESEGTGLESDGWRILAVQPVETQKSGPYDIAVRIRRTPERLLSADGDREEFPGSEEAYTTRVRWQGRQWRMQTFDQTT